MYTANINLFYIQIYWQKILDLMKSQITAYIYLTPQKTPTLQ